MTKLAGAIENGELVYTYSTHLSIVAQYVLNETLSEPFTDTVTSEVKFKAANFGMQPLYSKKTIVSHSPTDSNAATKIEECYTLQSYTLETTYLADCTGGTSTIVRYNPSGDASQPIVNEFTVDLEKLSCLDNEQLLAVARCMRTGTTSAKANVYSPFSNMVQKVGFTFSAEETKKYTFARNDNPAVEEVVTFRPVSIVLDERNPGETQKAEIAKYEEVGGVNKNRSVILSLTTPLPYNLGILKYTLKSINHTK